MRSQRELLGGAMAEAAGSSRGSASRPTGAASQRTLVVASFNFGVNQVMLTGKETTVAKHLNNFTRVCGKCVLESEADVLFGSELGGHRLGPGAFHIDLRGKLPKPFGRKCRCARRRIILARRTCVVVLLSLPLCVKQTSPRCARHEEQTAKWTTWRVVLLSLPATAKWQWLLLVPHRRRDARRPHTGSSYPQGRRGCPRG